MTAYRRSQHEEFIAVGSRSLERAILAVAPVSDVMSLRHADMGALNESAAPIERPPPFLMTALCLVASGWVGAAFVSFASVVPQGGFAGSGRGLGLWLGYSTLLSAVVGGFVLRALLPRLVAVEIVYAWAVLALGAGSLVGDLFAAAVQRYTADHAGPSAPIVFSDPIVTLGFTALSLLVSYSVIVLTGHGPRARPPAFAPRPSPPSAVTSSVRPYADTLGAQLVRTENSVTETCISISRAPAAAIPGCVTEAMLELATCANTLRAGRASDPNVRAAVSLLVDGLDRFQNALADIAGDAAAYGSGAIVQTGLLFPTTSDTGDGGSRARYELDHADGLATIRDALDRLRGLGAFPEER